jgi:hypothetical protein
MTTDQAIARGAIAGNGGPRPTSGLDHYATPGIMQAASRAIMAHSLEQQQSQGNYQSAIDGLENRAENLMSRIVSGTTGENSASAQGNSMISDAWSNMPRGSFNPEFANPGMARTPNGEAPVQHVLHDFERPNPQARDPHQGRGQGQSGGAWSDRSTDMYRRMPNSTASGRAHHPGIHDDNWWQHSSRGGGPVYEFAIEQPRSAEAPPSSTGATADREPVSERFGTSEKPVKGSLGASGHGPIRSASMRAKAGGRSLEEVEMRAAAAFTKIGDSRGRR